MTHDTQKDQLRALLNGGEGFDKWFDSPLTLGWMDADILAECRAAFREAWESGWQARDPLISELLEVVKVMGDALRVSNRTMQGAENLIASSGLHTQWHQHGKEHGAYHDLLFKRLRNEEALTRAQHLLDLLPMEKNNG